MRSKPSRQPKRRRAPERREPETPDFVDQAFDSLIRDMENHCRRNLTLKVGSHNEVAVEKGDPQNSK